MAVLPIPGFFEPVNSIMHLVAAGIFAYLGVQLLRHNRGDRLRLGLLAVFAGACVLMLSMSGVYHMLAGGSAGAAVMIRVDKAAIFVLIAGTFTPVHGLLFRGAVRWVGLAMMWAAAATGVTLMTVYFDRIPYGLGTALYIGLGWIAGVSLVVEWKRRGFRFVLPILAGGVAYSAGAIMLGANWPTIVPEVFGPHELWHVGVITGIALHWRFVSHLAREHREGRRA